MGATGDGGAFQKVAANRPGIRVLEGLRCQGPRSGRLDASNGGMGVGRAGPLGAGGTGDSYFDNIRVVTNFTGNWARGCPAGLELRGPYVRPSFRRTPRRIFLVAWGT